MKYSRISLSREIKRVIGNRVLFCSFVFIVIILALTFYDLMTSMNELRNRVNEEVRPVENFVISQVMINNKEIINLKIDDFNDANSTFHITWVPDGEPQFRSIVWKPPFSWVYDYKLGSIAEYQFGYFKVTGSFFKDKQLVNDLFIRLGLLLIFSLTVFLVLYPLARRIPERLFINPINRFLSLISNPISSKTDVSSHLPIELEELETKILSLLEQAKERERNQAAIELGRLTTQVAHDIRAPLEVLNLTMTNVTSIPEKARLDIKNAVQRVNDIANNLLSQYKRENGQVNSGDQISSELLALLLDSIVSEKRIHVSKSNIQIKFEINKDAFDTFVAVNAGEFKRALSNIINNAIEAVNDDGIISITLSKKDKKAIINIADNGRGIPKDQLAFVFEEGKSFGKKQGLGLGLTYAKERIAHWHGSCSLTSEEGVGTRLEISLPEAPAAEWFADKVIIPESSTVVILDDDEYIHEIWNARFTRDFIEQHHLTILHFHTPAELIHFCENNQKVNTVFLLDYELLGYPETGLHLAESLKIGFRSTLVTSRYEDLDIRAMCKKLGMKIIPKLFADKVKITVMEKADFILIDDDKLITNLWRESAENTGKILGIFNNPQDFIRVLHLYDKDTTIYIDSSLGNDIKGESFAKGLYNLGYKNLILESCQGQN